MECRQTWKQLLEIFLEWEDSQMIKMFCYSLFKYCLFSVYIFIIFGSENANKYPKVYFQQYSFKIFISCSKQCELRLTLSSFTFRCIFTVGSEFRRKIEFRLF